MRATLRVRLLGQHFMLTVYIFSPIDSDNFITSAGYETPIAMRPASSSLQQQGVTASPSFARPPDPIYFCNDGYENSDSSSYHQLMNVPNTGHAHPSFPEFARSTVSNQSSVLTSSTQPCPRKVSQSSDSSRAFTASSSRVSRV